MDTLPDAPPEPARRTRRFKISSVEVLCAILLVAILAQTWLQQVFDVPALRDFLGSPQRRLFLAELLASFTRVSSGRYRVVSRQASRTSSCP